MSAFLLGMSIMPNSGVKRIAGLGTVIWPKLFRPNLLVPPGFMQPGFLFESLMQHGFCVNNQHEFVYTPGEIKEVSIKAQLNLSTELSCT